MSWSRRRDLGVIGLVIPAIGALAAAPAIARAAPTGDGHATSHNTVFAIQVIGGLVALLVLAYLGGHRRVVRFQERLGIGGVITAGFRSSRSA